MSGTPDPIDEGIQKALAVIAERKAQEERNNMYAEAEGENARRNDAALDARRVADFEEREKQYRLTSEFLHKRLGLSWDPVSVGAEEYGIRGKEVSIEPVSRFHSATHFKSSPMSQEAADETASKLGDLGFSNPDHFTKIDTNGAGIILLLTHDGVALAKTSEALARKTAHLPLIRESGLSQKKG